MSGETIEPDQVVLVDENDTPVGNMEKMEAHRKGLRHRAFSILIFNSRGELLLQRRSMQKHHFRGLWSNSCCSHPRPDEGLIAAARRRLRAEFGFDTDLTDMFSISYRFTDPSSGLIENEIDHVLFGSYNGDVHPDGAEIDGFCWMPFAHAAVDCRARPESYTPWFRSIIDAMERKNVPIPGVTMEKY